MEIAWVAQGFGFVAFVLLVSSFQAKSRARILSLALAASIMFAVHFGLLEAWTGAGMNALSAIRTFVFKKRTEAKWAENPLWLYLFLMGYTITAVVTWEGYLSLLPLWGMIFGTLAYWSKEPRLLRRLNILAPPAWFTYDYFIGSYAGMLNEVFVFVSVLVGIIRFDILHKKEPVLR